MLKANTKIKVVCKNSKLFCNNNGEHEFNGIVYPKANKASFAYRKGTMSSGVNDVGFMVSVTINHVRVVHPLYTAWKRMIRSCYSKRTIEHGFYSDMTMDDGWIFFSNFLKWAMSRYKNNWVLSNAIVEPGNMHYSPAKCVFVPFGIVGLLSTCSSQRGDAAIGVQRINDHCFCAHISRGNKKTHLGTFPTEQEALNAYLKCKAQYLRQIARRDLGGKAAVGLRKHAAMLEQQIVEPS